MSSVLYAEKQSFKKVRQLTQGHAVASLFPGIRSLSSTPACKSTLLPGPGDVCRRARSVCGAAWSWVVVSWKMDFFLVGKG